MGVLDLRYIDWNNLTVTSPGMVPKYIDSNKFYKLSSYNELVGFYGTEPIYEELAFHIGKSLGVNVVKTDTLMAKIIYNGIEYETLVSISPNFSQNKQYFPIEKYCLVNNLMTLDLFKSHYSSELFNILIFDFIINNKDRHGRNIELNEWEIAPCFDNSFSFCSKIEDSQLNPKLYQDYMANNYIGYPNLYKNLELILNPPELNLNKKDIFKIIDNWSMKYNISVTRTKFIKNLIEYRVNIVNNKLYNVAKFTWE